MPKQPDLRDFIYQSENKRRTRELLRLAKRALLVLMTMVLTYLVAQFILAVV